MDDTMTRYQGGTPPRADQKPVNLALQGGGAHGAFAWGVLDKLLEDGRLTIDAMSATSAGAMNAVVAAYGLSIGGPDGARNLVEAYNAYSVETNCCRACGIPGMSGRDRRNAQTGGGANPRFLFALSTIGSTGFTRRLAHENFENAGPD